jgi:valyl-tRNA synthetase
MRRGRTFLPRRRLTAGAGIVSQSNGGAGRAEPVRYNFRETETKWRRVWEERGTFRATADRSRPKYYVLEMFPYPSGRIHIGHVRNYTQGDVVARYRRAKGFNVLHPMGWDAFGLPAENAAIEQKVHPRKWTYENIATMKAQLKTMGLSLDWSRELATCDPTYYRHQQKMFLDFWKAGLAYRKEAWVNWDPVDNTVLANEQVIDGKGWRTGATVERRKLAQWNLKITHFADELLERLDTMARACSSNWRARVRRLARRSRSSQPGRIRCSVPRSWRFRPTIRWRRASPVPTRHWPTSSPSAGARAPVPPRSRPPKRRATAPRCPSSMRSSPAKRCPSTSPTSC